MLTRPRRSRDLWGLKVLGESVIEALDRPCDRVASPCRGVPSVRLGPTLGLEPHLTDPAEVIVKPPLAPGALAGCRSPGGRRRARSLRQRWRGLAINASPDAMGNVASHPHVKIVARELIVARDAPDELSLNDRRWVREACPSRSALTWSSSKRSAPSRRSRDWRRVPSAPEGGASPGRHYVPTANPGSCRCFSQNSSTYRGGATSAFQSLTASKL